MTLKQLACQNGFKGRGPVIRWKHRAAGIDGPGAWCWRVESVEGRWHPVTTVAFDSGPEYEYQDVDGGRNGEWQTAEGHDAWTYGERLPGRRLLGAQFIWIQGKVVSLSLEIIAGSDFLCILGRSRHVGTRSASIWL